MRYFDCNATAPLSCIAKKALLEALDTYWANPAASYGPGAQAHTALENVRQKIAHRLGVSADQIIFTSGASEGNNAVIRYWARQFEGGFIALSPFEHPSVYKPARIYFGARMCVLPVDSQGRVDVAASAMLLDANPHIRCLSILAASNETGMHQPWSDLVNLCQARGIAYHVDASQWVGRERMHGFSEVDFVTAGAHKYGGPVGVGWMKIPVQAPDFCIQYGGGQENGYRSGTQAVALIMAMEAVWAWLENNLERERPIWESYRVAFEDCLLELLPGLRILGQELPRLWNTSTLVMPAHDQLRWQQKLERIGFYVGTGAACNNIDKMLSPGLFAMGLDEMSYKRVLRISASPDHSSVDWLDLAKALTQVSDELKLSSLESTVVDVQG